MDRLSWVFQLFDRMSGPANNIARSMRGAQSAIGGAGGGALTAGQNFALMGAGIAGWISIAGKAIDIALKFSQAMLSIGEAVGTVAMRNLAFRETTLATMKAIFGSEDSAKRMYDLAANAASKTPFSVKQVASAFGRIGAAGFSEVEVPIVFQGVSDLSSVAGRGAEGMNSLVLAMGQIMGRGHLAGQELNQITEATNGIVSRISYFSKIATIMKVNQSAVESMMEKGLIPARVAIMALMQTAKEKGGGVIGQVGIDQSKTLAGLWEQLTSKADEMFLTMDGSKMRGLETAKGVLTNLVSIFDSSTDAGRAFQVILEDVINGTLGRLDGWTGQDGLTRMIDLLRDVGGIMKTVWNVGVEGFGALIDGFKYGAGPVLDMLGMFEEGGDSAYVFQKSMAAIGTIVGWITVAVTGLVAALGWLIATLETITAGIMQMFGALGEGIVGGLLNGLTGNWGQAADSIAYMGENLVGGFKRMLGINSPSKVFEEIGANTAEGFALGVDGGMKVDAATSVERLTSPTARAPADAPGGAVTVHLSIPVTVNGSGDSASTAEAVLARLREMLPSAVADVFEQMALEGGVA